jgi:hypothetical protein
MGSGARGYFVKRGKTLMARGDAMRLNTPISTTPHSGEYPPVTDYPGYSPTSQYGWGLD